MPRLVSLQVLRFVAAALVILCHSYEPARIGAVGVDIFFVISGFIITRMMSTKTSAQFIRDRLLRIYPIYWVCAVPTALVAVYIGATTLPRTLTSVTLWPVFGGTYLQPYLVLGWTLSFEMLFYACAALVLVDRRVLWVIAIGFPLAMAAAFAASAPLFRFIGNPMIIEFLMGVLIARANGGAKPVAGLLAAALAIGLLALSDAERLYLPLRIFELTAPDRVLAWGIPAAMLVWGALQLEPYVQNWRLLPHLGDASYSIYLSQGTGLMLAVLLPWPLQIAAAVAFGTAVHNGIEMPMLRALRRRVRLPCKASSALT
ncbi:MAG TPA: acyltransferase [Nitrobacter sp.]|nr:acyltransferase [Nitrobacter sp.]